MFTHRTLRWQWDFAGTRLQNLRILVCDTGCEDVPQDQLRAKVISPDPLPIFNARPEPFTVTGFSYDESNIVVMPPPSIALGANQDGPQMLMPDGLTVMLMPDNPTGL